jgi:hypothetical protein
MLKEKHAEFEKLPEVTEWLDGINVKPSTRAYYVKRLYEFLEGESPKTFLERALSSSRDVSIEIKSRIGKMAQRSASLASQTQVAVKSFLDFYETNIHVNGKIRIRKKWAKEFLSWENAERIISKCREPYESIFRFMLWSGVGQDEVIEINESPEIQKQIQEQMSNSKDYVRIDLQPRKMTLTQYFVLVPKQYVPSFPFRTADYKVRGNKPLHREAMEEIFRRAAKRVNLYKKGMGPHTLRSAFTSQCAMAGVVQAVAEFAKGHGGADKYGYSREVLNEEYMVKELRKLWSFVKPASQEAVKSLEEQNRFLREIIEGDLKADIEKLEAEKKEKLREYGIRARRLTLREEKSHPDIKGIDEEIDRKKRQLEQLSKAGQH